MIQCIEQNVLDGQWTATATTGHDRTHTQRTDGQRTDDGTNDGTNDGTDDGTDEGTDGRTEDDDDDDDDDGIRRREDIHLYLIIRFQIQYWDQVSNVTINRPSSPRFRDPQ